MTKKEFKRLPKKEKIKLAILISIIKLEKTGLIKFKGNQEHYRQSINGPLDYITNKYHFPPIEHSKFIQEGFDNNLIVNDVRTGMTTMDIEALSGLVAQPRYTVYEPSKFIH